ncbi:MAG: hypothetical protein EGR83_25720 [Bacteroides cellulosilyticus]|nr:hypothetical protein [Bacteroides cellulosilyticus]
MIIPSRENVFFPPEDKGRRKKRKDFILQKRRKKGKSTFGRTLWKDLSPFGILKLDIRQNADKKWNLPTIMSFTQPEENKACFSDGYTPSSI